MDCGEDMKVVRGGIRRMVIASTLVAWAVALGACSLGGSRAHQPSRPQASSLPAGPTASIRLVPVPDALIMACRRAQRRASHPFLCPSRLPRPYRHYLPLRPLAFGAVFLAHQAVVDVSYATDHGRGHPDEFLHFVVGRATEGLPHNGRPARLGGRRGLLAPASSGSSFVGPYFANHVRFLWREHGVSYVATLHLFDSGERATEVLLDRILRTLRPAGELTAFRPGGPRAAGIRVHAGPSELVLDASGPCVTSRGTDHAPGSRVTRIEAGSLATGPLEGVPEQGVFVAAGEGALWAAGSSRSPDPDSFTPPRLVRVDPTSGRVTARLGLGRDPLSAATGIVTGAGSVWVSLTDFDDGDAGQVWRLDPLARGVIARLRVGRLPSAMAVEGNSVWTVNAGDATISRIDAETNRVQTYKVARQPGGLVAAAGSIWLTHPQDGTVRRIEPASGRTLATIPVGGSAYGMAADKRGVWIALPGEGLVRRIDPETNTVAETIQLGGDPLSLASDGRVLWVAMHSDALVLRIELSKSSAFRLPAVAAQPVRRLDPTAGDPRLDAPGG
jgi:streptogramin lyase